MPTICLNMIVKDESAVIRRCLKSVKELLDYWVIVDTGSSDGTQDLIQEVLRDIPGKLYERPWVNFEHNRNESLDLARNKSDYILLIDADETLIISDEFKKSDLDKDFYLFRLIERSYTDLYRISLIRNHPCWFWEGVLHESINARQPMSGITLKTIVKDASARDGNRTKNPQKFLKDAEILEEALRKDPNNSRYVFYLAQSYGNGEQFSQALDLYERRTQMGGNPEEVFWSFHCLGLIHEHLGSDPSKIIHSYSKAYQHNPKRAEPLFQLANYFFSAQHPLIGYFLAKAALPLSAPQYGNYFHAWVYEYAALFCFARCAEAIGCKQEALDAYQLLLKKNLPSEIRDFVAKTSDEILGHSCFQNSQNQTMYGISL